MVLSTIRMWWQTCNHYHAGGHHCNHKDQHPKDWTKRLLDEGTMHGVELYGVVGRLMYICKTTTTLVNVKLKICSKYIKCWC